MDFFISSAYAQDGGGETGMVGLLFPLLILVFFYFIFIRPQQKRAKEHKLMTEGLKKGDEISTSGGLLGTVTEIGGHFVAVQIADNVVVKVQRGAVGNLLPKGTIKKGLTEQPKDKK